MSFLVPKFWRTVKSSLLLFCGGLLALVFPAIVGAVVPVDRTVQVSATVSDSPPSIKLSWPSDPNAQSYTVARRLLSDTAWGSPTTVLSTTNAFTDTAVAVGADYEYKVTKNATGYTGYGYINSAIKLPLVENRGTVILVVDNTYAADLAPELNRLKSDLVGDGWKVIRHDVSRTASVPSVKALIAADYAADPLNVKSVFLFGHVPVPYSGNLAPDGHGDHVGAWPADGFYGDMTGSWTDTMISSTTASRTQNRNVPGDGKYDQSSFPAALTLEVGRVDLADMPAFAPKTEKDLLRQYLNKDHNFRHKILTAPPRALVDDSFGDFSGEAFSMSAWRNFAPLVGATNTKSLDWFTTLNTQSYLWAYGAGGGSYTSASGVGNTSSFAMTDTQAVFTMLFGSYFGDWDSTNNFLRAPLATSYGLSSAWAGRPQWFYQHMGLGKTLGYSTRLTQNVLFSNLYTPLGFSASGVHVALMGDPTLRMSPVTPTGVLTGTATADGIQLSWGASPEADMGYHVYRASSPDGPFTRLTSAPVTFTEFFDNSAFNATYTYMVKAIKLQITPSGSYYNSSQGIFVTLPANCKDLLVTSAGDDAGCGTLRHAVNFLTAAPNTPNPLITLQLPGGTSKIQLTQGLTLPRGATLLAGKDLASSCAAGPTVTLDGSGVSGPGLVLSGGNVVSGFQVQGFSGPQLKVTAGGSPNRVLCSRFG